MFYFVKQDLIQSRIIILLIQCWTTTYPLIIIVLTVLVIARVLNKRNLIISQSWNTEKNNSNDTMSCSVNFKHWPEIFLCKHKLEFLSQFKAHNVIINVIHSRKYQQRLPYDLLSSLANCLLDDSIYKIVEGLQQIQHLTEKSLHEKRTKYVNENRGEIIELSVLISNGLSLSKKARTSETINERDVVRSYKLWESQSYWKGESLRKLQLFTHRLLIGIRKRVSRWSE